MPDLGDLQLDKAQDAPQSAGRPAIWRAALVFCLCLVLGFIVWNVLTSRRSAATTAVKVQTDQQVVQQPPKSPEAVAGERMDLAPLADTDPIVRQLVGRLSSHPLVAAWLATDQLLRNFTVVVVNIAEGKTPAQHLRAVRPTGEFIVAGEGAVTTIDPRTYRRYDAYADAVSGLDAQGTARLYATLKPRIQDAYRELGYPESDFDSALHRAIVHLLQTPAVDRDIQVTSRSVVFEFTDPKLEGLSSVQRQFLRMGPRNVRLIKSKLREIAPYLGIAPETLPQ